MVNQNIARELERLSGEYIRGYTKAIQDIQEVFTYIQQDLKGHHRNINGKLSLALLACCLENREKLREHREVFIRFNGQSKIFEWHSIAGKS